MVLGICVSRVSDAGPTLNCGSTDGAQFDELYDPAQLPVLENAGGRKEVETGTAHVHQAVDLGWATRPVSD